MIVDVIKFDTPPSVYWDDNVKISYLQRRVLVYSIMYYKHNDSCIADEKYDRLSRQLARLQQSATITELRKSTYYYAMHDFDGSTGFDLHSRLNNQDKATLSEIAATVHRTWRDR